jgi:hypothetical protein
VVYDINGREADEAALVLDAVGPIEQYIFCSSAGVYKKSDQMPHREEDEVDFNSRHKVRARACIAPQRRCWAARWQRRMGACCEDAAPCPAERCRSWRRQHAAGFSCPPPPPRTLFQQPLPPPHPTHRRRASCTRRTCWRSAG